MIYLASYKAVPSSLHGVINYLIRKTDSGNYSHSEIVVGHLEDLIAGGKSSESRKLLGLSATGGAGVSFESKDYCLDEWDFVALPWVTESVVRDTALTYLGRPYDYLGVLRFVLPWMTREHPVRFFCSELAGLCMGLEEPWRFTPCSLHALAKSKLGK